MQKPAVKKVELLSPARDISCAIAAINSGADALYIGAQAFGARKSAANSLSDIEEIVNYAHLFNVKVYIALNTILNDDEVPLAQKLIWDLFDIKADALIVQDFAIFYLSAENKLPPIPLHASTQCDIRNLEKVKFFENIGVKRVVLARETPLEDIIKIKKNTNIELEYFIHGALCACYSGQCYMSAYIGEHGQRSANRGECAQCCRKRYSLVDDSGKYLLKNKYLLSLKDNNLSEHIGKLIDAGVKSFKIEGRLKDENYVKNTTLYYNNLLKGRARSSFGSVFADYTPNLQKTFNRGYCDDYLFSKKDNLYNTDTPKSTGEYIGCIESSAKDSFVVKTKTKINPQDGLCFVLNNDLTGCLVNRVVEVSSGYKIFPNKKINPKVGDKVFRNIDFTFLKTLEKSCCARKLDVNFKISKNKIEISDERSNKIELPLEGDVAQNFSKMKENYIKSLSKTSDTPFNVKNIDFADDEFTFLPVSKINEIRRLIFEKLSEKILLRYKTKTQKPLNIAKYPLEYGNFKLNIHNKLAKEFIEMCRCRVDEMSFESSNPNSLHPPLELMEMRHCLRRMTLGCGDKTKLFLVDDAGVKFPLRFSCDIKCSKDCFENNFKTCTMSVLAP